MDRLSIPEESVSTYVDNIWFQKSLSAFIRPLETVLGEDVVKDHVITYVGDHLTHSTSFSITLTNWIGFFIN